MVEILVIFNPRFFDNGNARSAYKQNFVSNKVWRRDSCDPGNIAQMNDHPGFGFRWTSLNRLILTAMLGIPMRFIWVAFLFVLGMPGLANADATTEYAFPGVPFISAHMIESSPKPRIPRYPIMARAKGIQGKVVVAVKVGTNGEILESKIIEAEPPNVFEKVTEDAIGSWRFKRLSINGEGIVYQTKIPVTFSLADQNEK